MVPDPRDPRGVRHPLPAVLALCTAAVLSGNTAFEDVAAWAYRAPQEVLAACGARRNALGAHVAPSPDTVERIFGRLGAQALADHAGAYLAVRAQAGPATPGVGAVLAERLTGAKTNEVPELAPLLRELDSRLPLAGHVITADAARTVRAHASLICGDLMGLVQSARPPQVRPRA